VTCELDSLYTKRLLLLLGNMIMVT